MVTSSWMAQVPDSKSIKDMAIPGTHDSATYKMVTGETKCQDRDMGHQVNEGIRCFDIRVGYQGQLYHGDFACSVTLNEVVDLYIAHLEANPREAILVIMGWEGVKSYGIGAFKSWCAPALSGARAKFWHFASTIPTLGEVRGKMVLINGDDTGKPGLSMNSFKCKNDWDVGNAGQTPQKRAQLKVDLIKGFLGSSGPGKEMLMNCWNKQFNFGVPVSKYAEMINGAMDSWNGPYPRGIQSMDFYHGNIVERIISSPVNK